MLQAWPGYLTYLVSFLTIGVSWLLHTALTDRMLITVEVRTHEQTWGKPGA